ncbi:regulator RcnB of Ni and Co efflux [Ralstonia sp. 25mfcol4.1]|uniref:RcnB family protein n=1 Tax=Burkholderiaceae TaxID=119060 RepID=UPI000887735F|nr:RcnB family protein [Ralstonia sp. 25mfcol4.1]SDP40697.1 regulator RcnB of Ni and Co efflux [Ralstonia sp. 25mfcol4.1]
MQTKTLIPAVLVAAGLLAVPLAQAQQQQPMPGQTQPSGPTPMPSPGQAGAMPPNATPMPPATSGKQPHGTSQKGQSAGSQGNMSQGGMSSSGSMSQGSMSSGQPGSTPMGAQSPYSPKKWNKGEKLPAEFRDRQYVIDKYKDYNLPAPKKGYHWVGVGADYYQVSSNGTIYSVGPGG